jgi:hypothetical protein
MCAARRAAVSDLRLGLGRADCRWDVWCTRRGATEDVAAGVRVMDDAQLRTIWQQRQMGGDADHLSFPLTVLLKRTLEPRVRQLSKLAEIWDQVVPEAINRHTALERFHRGVLTVLVDSAAHRFQLDTLLRGGLQKAIQARFPGALTKVRLVPGQFYAVDFTGAPRYAF